MPKDLKHPTARPPLHPNTKFRSIKLPDMLAADGFKNCENCFEFIIDSSASKCGKCVELTACSALAGFHPIVASDPLESTPRFAEDHDSISALIPEFEAGILSEESDSDGYVDAYVITSQELERKILQEKYSDANFAKTLGDTHGDIYNNLTALIKAGIIKVKATEFDYFKREITNLRATISTDRVLLRHTASLLMDVVAQAVTYDAPKDPVYVRYNGDQECDRGLHDGLNIEFVIFLKEKLNIHPRILFSNHGNFFLKYAREFIKADYNRPACWRKWDISYKATIASFIRLCKSIEQEGPDADISRSFRGLLHYYLKEIYTDVLLLDYSELSDGQLVIYSHAPICGTMILDIYNLLVNPEISEVDLMESYNNKDRLKTAIIEINIKFQELIKRHINGIFSADQDKQFDLNEYIHRPENVALLAVIWRRLSEPMQYPSITLRYGDDVTFPDYIYRNVHGHDSPIGIDVEGQPVLPAFTDEPLYFGSKSYCINAQYYTCAPEFYGELGQCNIFDPAAAERLIIEQRLREPIAAIGVSTPILFSSRLSRFVQVQSSVGEAVTGGFDDLVDLEVRSNPRI